MGNGLVSSVLDSQSLGAGFNARTEVYILVYITVSFLTSVNRVILTVLYIGCDFDPTGCASGYKHTCTQVIHDNVSL